jgi:hypothetical protein
LKKLLKWQGITPKTLKLENLILWQSHFADFDNDVDALPRLEQNHGNKKARLKDDIFLSKYTAAAITKLANKVGSDVFLHL